MSLGACAAVPVAALADGKPCVVSAENTPFYRYGPAQSFGPDFQLLRGSRVLLVRRGFGFSRIQTEAGVPGYVPTEDLAAEPERVRVAEEESDVRPELLTGSGAEEELVPERLEVEAGSLPVP